MNCTDFLRILWILMDFVHNPYRCGPIRVGMYDCHSNLYILGIGNQSQSTVVDAQ